MGEGTRVLNDDDVCCFELENGDVVEIKEGYQQLGTGAQGVILLGVLKTKSRRWEDVAVKCSFTFSNADAEEIMKEIKVLENLPPHPNIIRCFGGAAVPIKGFPGCKMVYTVLELMAAELESYIFGNYEFRRECTFRDLLHIFISVANGLSHLHAHDMVHFDIKMGNILVSANGEVKIADFGLCEVVDEHKKSIVASHKGTQGYIAPEVTYNALSQGVYQGRMNSVTSAVDIYSFGCVMLRCLNFGDDRSLYSAWAQRNGRDIRIPQLLGANAKFFCNGPEKVCEMIENCLRFKGHKLPGSHGRPNAAELVRTMQSMLREKWAHNKVFCFEKELEDSPEDSKLLRDRLVINNCCFT